MKPTETSSWISRRQRSHRRRERGSQIVELAIALPLLTLMAMMVAEGSALLQAHQVINNAAREGARLSALPENNGGVAEVQNAVVSYAAQNGVPIAAANVAVDQGLLVATGSGI